MAEEESIPSVKELRRFFSQKGNGLRPQKFKKKEAGPQTTPSKQPSSKGGGANPFSRSRSAGDLTASLAPVPVPIQDTDHITSYSIKAIKQLLENKTFGMQRDQSKRFPVKKSCSASQMALDANWTLSSERKPLPKPNFAEPANTMLNRFRMAPPADPPQPAHVSSVQCLGTQLLEAEKKERKSSTINLIINPPTSKIHRSEVSVFVNAEEEDLKPRIVNFTNKTTSGEVITPSYPGGLAEDPVIPPAAVNIVIKNPSPTRKPESPPSPPRRCSADPYQFCRPGDRLLATQGAGKLRTLPPSLGPAPGKPDRPSCVVMSLERILKSLRPWKSREEDRIVAPPAEKPGFDMLREIERELMLRRSSWHTHEGSGSEYDDVLGRAPPIPRSLDSSTCTPPSDEIYQDVFDGDVQNIYETVPMEDDVLSEFASTFYVNTTSKDDKKSKHKKDKELERLKKKYGMTGHEVPLDVGFAKQDSKRRSSDLSVRKGETLYILRMENNPSGKWLVRSVSGKVGYMELSNIAVDASTVKSAMLSGTHGPLSAINPLCAFLSQDKEEAIYEVTY